MAHQSFDEHMAALDALKGRALEQSDLVFLRKSLANRSNLLVSKAAALAESNDCKDLRPDLEAAFERFFTNPEKSDPQCWAKNALSRALSRLGCRDKDVFLRGLHHHQMEPTWGGRSDSAGTLRANCAHALIGCDGLIAQDLLLLLLDLLADPDKAVRVETIRALSQLGDLAVPVLRLRALIPGEDAEVLAVCFGALLAIDRTAAIPFVARFLLTGDDAAGEAAFALAETRHPAALEALLAARRKPSPPDAHPWFAAALLSAIALTRLPQAENYLLQLIESEDREAKLALEALFKLDPAPDLRARIQQAVDDADSPRLRKTLSDHLSSAP